MLTSSSVLLFLLPSMLLAESLKLRLFLMSPLDVRVVREFLIAVKVGLYLSPVLVLRIRSKNGTEPFFGRPCTCVVNAGCEAFRGITGLVYSVLSVTPGWSSSMPFRERDFTAFLRSMLPLLLVAPLDECSCTFTSEMVGNVGTVGTDVRGVPLVSLYQLFNEPRARRLHNFFVFQIFNSFRTKFLLFFYLFINPNKLNFSNLKTSI